MFGDKTLPESGVIAPNKHILLLVTTAIRVGKTTELRVIPEKNRADDIGT